MRIQLFFPLLFCLILIPLITLPAAGTDEQPAITDITITASGGKMLLSAAAKNCFTKEMLEGVHNAIPITFRFKIDFERIRSYWFNQNINDLGINHTLSYDPIRREYQVAFSEKLQPQTTRSLGEAQRMMAELRGLEIANLNQLTSGLTYTLNVKATLVENTFPLGLHSIIPFTSLWNFETDWRAIEFKY